jgi:hypothetical protein
MGLSRRPTNSSRRRKVIIITTLLSLACADAVIRLGGPHLQSYHIDLYQRKLDTLRRQPGKPDIILMGSSRAQLAFVPEEFQRTTGRRTFNFALSGSRVPEWQWLMDNCINRLRPPLVVLGINVHALRADYLPVPAARNLFSLGDLIDYLQADGWSSEMDGQFLISNCGRRWALFDKRFETKMFLQEQLEPVLPKYAQLAREHRTWASRAGPPDGYSHPWLHGRHLRGLVGRLEDNSETTPPVFNPSCSPNGRVVERFEDLLRWFNEREIPLIVAYVPQSPWHEQGWGDLESLMVDTIASLCRRHGIEFVSCTHQDLPRSNRDFLDETHVGLPLAHRISRRIAERIQELALLPPKRQQLAHSMDREQAQP